MIHERRNSIGAASLVSSESSNLQGGLAERDKGVKAVHPAEFPANQGSCGVARMPSQNAGFLGVRRRSVPCRWQRAVLLDQEDEPSSRSGDAQGADPLGQLHHGDHRLWRDHHTQSDLSARRFTGGKRSTPWPVPAPCASKDAVVHPRLGVPVFAALRAVDASVGAACDTRHHQRTDHHDRRARCRSHRGLR
jgi:hypothetical protein